MFSSYRPNPYSWGYPQRYRQAYVDEEAQARARALAAQRARRAQWLPDEADEDDWEYNDLPPRERMLLEAARRRQQLEQQQRQQDIARQRALEEARWQRQLEERQREDEERRRRILEEQRRIQQLRQEREEAMLRAEAMRRQSRARSQSPQRQASPPRSPTQETSKPRTPSPKPSTPTPQYDERHEEAASKIQNRYRIHRSFQTITRLEQQFKDSQLRFTFPSTIDFQRPGTSNDAQDHISVPFSGQADSEIPSEEPMDVDGQPEGKLAYTSNNFALNGYLDEMLKLLTKLDGVESWGEKMVRERRRSVVKEIEKEMSRVDGYWKRAWRDYLTSKKQKEATEAQEEAEEFDYVEVEKELCDGPSQPSEAVVETQ